MKKRGAVEYVSSVVIQEPNLDILGGCVIGLDHIYDDRKTTVALNCLQ